MTYHLRLPAGALLLLLTLPALAQTEAMTIGISPFSYSSYLEGRYVNELTETVSTELVRSNRFTVLDRTKLRAVTDERELQKSEAFIDSRVIAQGRSLGARYLITGHLASVGSSNAYIPELGRYQYKARLIVSLKIIDVETGAVLHAETFGKGTAGGIGGFFSAWGNACDQDGIGTGTEQAIKSAIANVGCGVNRWIKQSFPVMASIVEVQETHKRRGAETVLLAAGKTAGLSLYQKLKVVELVAVTVDGRSLVRQKEIGMLSVRRIEDDNFSICSVVDGGIEIAEKLTAKVPLKVVIQ
jgi:curli biogenesis system outer membrane secretion channel CsgG